MVVSVDACPRTSPMRLSGRTAASLRPRSRGVFGAHPRDRLDRRPTHAVAHLFAR